MEKEIEKIKEYAKINNIPIMMDEGIEFLINYIEKNNVKDILEIGAAIGYSAIRMALVSKDVKVQTVERDEIRYNEAVINIKKFKLEDQIKITKIDAFDYIPEGMFDLIFIDAAKAQNTRFFEKFSPLLRKDGTIITDNMNFHGFVDDPSTIHSRNLRALVRKVRNYHIYLEENKDYDTKFLDLGDGLAITKKHIKEK